MTTAAINCFGTIFTFELNIEDLLSDCIEICEIPLSNIYWKIILFKISTFESGEVKNHLSVSLESSIRNRKINWTCEASAVFKLQHSKREIVKYLPKYEFSNVNRLFAGPLKCIPMIDHMKTGLHIVLENVNSLSTHCSAEVILHDIRWRFFSKRNNNMLSVYVTAAEDDNDLNWSFYGKFSIFLLNFDSKYEPVHKTFSETFRRGKGCGIDIINWAQFIDPREKYLSNNCSKLLIDFHIFPPTPLWSFPNQYE